MYERTRCRIVGHFDLFTKYNEDDGLFDTAHPRYRAAWRSAADRLIGTGIPFELNTGAISRGVRKDPYPSEEILSYLGSRGAPVVLSSDAHAASDIMYSFDRLHALAKAYGLRVVEL